jgi:N-acetylated-alpha-linked acidic dipeptidase
MLRHPPFAIVVFAHACPALAQTFSSADRWPEPQRAAHQQFETMLNAVPTPQSLRAYHDLLASEPHIAGTPGDERTIQRLLGAFKAAGVDDVRLHEFWAYLGAPVEAKLEVIDETEKLEGAQTVVQRSVTALQIQEHGMSLDGSDHPDLPIGFNAYSGSGDITADVVYANYGAKDDFEKLKALGVDCAGKIVIARYGKNFRGYKAKFAQQAGAVGLIIYTDPDDGGYRKGVPYPEGGWANESYIQRGSINTLDYAGDPLTPGIGATQDATRLNPDDIALPRIPVQPIGYGAASQIMGRMRGRALPPDLVNQWQGGMPFAYRLESGGHFRVRLMVKQQRAITKSANVIATVRGSKYPDEQIIIGCHHDAWGCGASDPLAGTILVLEAAKSFAHAARNGQRPLRTVVFALWGAEEYGIIGSTEYCEQHRDDLTKNAVAYINLDMAAMGPNFDSSASPTLKKIIEEVTRDVPQINSTDGQPIYRSWVGGSGEASFGNLGGGSDHVGFYCHLGIPSCSLGGGGSRGVSYHSNYDNLHWYRMVVGEDYQPAFMLTRAVNVLAARLSSAPVVPLEIAQYAKDFKLHLQGIVKRARELDLTVDFATLTQRADAFELLAMGTASALQEAVAAGRLNEEKYDDVNDALRMMERHWLRPPSPNPSERDWFANLYATSDPDSGYAAWMLPGLRTAIEARNLEMIEDAASEYELVFDRLTKATERVRGIVAD